MAMHGMGRRSRRLACAVCAVLVLTTGIGRSEAPSDEDLSARMSRLEEINETLLRQNSRLEMEIESLNAAIQGRRDIPQGDRRNTVTAETGADQDAINLPQGTAAGAQANAPVAEPAPQWGTGAAEEANALDPTIQAIIDKLTWSKGDFRIVPFGTLECQSVGASDSVTGRAVVNFVNPDSAVSQPEFNIFGQTSTLGADFKGPEVLGMQSGGRILTAFVGDRPLLNQSTPLLVNAYGELTNENCRFLFGTFFPIISPLSPDSVAFAPGVATGNLGVFRGQLRGERYLRFDEAMQLTLQAGITQQVVNDFVPLAGLGAIGSDNGWPNIETRVALALGTQDQTTKERPVEFGLGGVIGQARAVAGDVGRVSDTWGIASDFRAKLTNWFGCKGEVYTGQALGTYGGGISQSLNVLDGAPIRSTGGWGEVYVKPGPKAMASVGYGIDAPLEEDLAPFNRARNEYYFGAVFYDVTRFLNIGAEVDYRRTAYMLPSTDNDAVVYYFRARLKF